MHGTTAFLLSSAKPHSPVDKISFVSSFQSPSIKRINSDGVIKISPLSHNSSVNSLAESSCHNFFEITGPFSNGAQVHNDLSYSISQDDNSDDDKRKESTRKTRHHSDAPIPVSDRDGMPICETMPGQVDIAPLFLSRFSSTNSLGGQSDFLPTRNDRSYDRAVSHDYVHALKKELELCKCEERKNQKRLRKRYKSESNELEKAKREISEMRLQQDETSKRRNEEMDQRERLFREKKERFKTKRGIHNHEKVQFQKDVEQFKREQKEVQVRYKKRKKKLDENERLFSEKETQFNSKASSFNNEKLQFEKDTEQFKHDQTEFRVKSKKRNRKLDDRERSFKEKVTEFDSEVSAFNSEKVEFENDLKHSQRELQVLSGEVEETKKHFRVVKFRWFLFLFVAITLLLEFAAIILFLASRSIIITTN